MSYFDLNNDVKPDRISDNDICIYMYIYLYIEQGLIHGEDAAHQAIVVLRDMPSHAIDCNLLLTGKHVKLFVPNICAKYLHQTRCRMPLFVIPY